MEPEVLTIQNLGGSLPVENVQALASMNMKEIPQRYLRPEVELDEVSVEDSLRIPVIDMSKLLESSEIHHHEELSKLHFACRDWGFFQVQIYKYKNFRLSITLLIIRNYVLIFTRIY